MKDTEYIKRVHTADNEARYIIELTEDEFNVLATILGYIGGSPEWSYRQDAENMADKVRAAMGIETYWQATDPYDYVEPGSRIGFRNW